MAIANTILDRLNGFLAFLKGKKPFKGRVTKWTPEMVENDDPVAREVIARAMNSGKVVIANRNEDGSITISEQ